MRTGPSMHSSQAALSILCSMLSHSPTWAHRGNAKPCKQSIGAPQQAHLSKRLLMSSLRMALPHWVLQ